MTEVQAVAQQKTILRIVFRRERAVIHGSPEYRCLSPQATFERALWAIKRAVSPVSKGAFRTASAVKEDDYCELSTGRVGLQFTIFALLR